MRVIGGQLKGRRFQPPAKNWPTRPTTDMAREALFNILQNRLDFEDLKALDLFGGSGSQCYELFSRGCRDITYVDRHYACVKFVKQQVVTFEAKDAIRIVRADVFKFIKSDSHLYDYIFCDPPYGLDSLGFIPDLIFEYGLLVEGGVLVMEHDQRTDFSDHVRCTEVRSYGGSKFSFFE